MADLAQSGLSQAGDHGVHRKCGIDEFKLLGVAEIGLLHKLSQEAVGYVEV
jgi:hypothetical protein